MELKIIKCPICGEKLVRNIKNFKKYSYPVNNSVYHEICRKCEEKLQIEKEWKGDLLLCHLCGQYLPISNFKASDHYPLRNHLDARCSKCRTKLQKKARKRYTQQEALIKILLQRYLCARDRALRGNLEFNITKEFLLQLWEKQNGLCALSNIKMTFIFDEGRTPTNVSIDRINALRGYTKDNVQLVCMAINLMKSDLSMDDLYFFAEALVKNKKK